MKILRTIGILALVAGLVLGSVGSALAQKPDGVPRGGGPHSPAGKRGLSGNVTAVDNITAGVEYVISLETKHWGTVNITANFSGTKYMVPRETRGSANLTRFLKIVDQNDDGNLEELLGRRLAVLVTNFVEVDTNGFTADAIRLMLIPSHSSPPSHAHRVGEVTTFVPGEDGYIIIKVEDEDGVTHEFEVSEDTVYRPAEIAGLTGDPLIEAITGGYVTVVTKGDLEAKAIVLHKKTED